MMDLYGLKIWVAALRLPFLTVTVVPVLLGSAIAWNETGRLIPVRFLLALIGGIFIHLGLNLCNDYFDHLSGNDEANNNPTPFSGGSRVIQNKLLVPKQILFASIICFGMGSAIGIYLNTVCQKNIILFLGLTGVFLAYFYSAGPLKIGHYYFGELAVGIGFGPIIVFGSYYVHAEKFAWQPVAVSIPVGILTALVLFINEFPDHDADKIINKKTMVVALGKKTASAVFRILIVSVYLLTVIGIILAIFPLFSLLIMLTFPLAVKAIYVSKKYYDRICELLPANKSTINLQLLFGVLLTVSFILDGMRK